ncbi:hypothetical protein BCR42DRAFT_406791 [Absidia repens]|uniref:Secreted protein n=1 Tax=Absidia repens TaxID=90262 RepID=A0A1X2IRG1_9FUNG|nr:hypothetical protein BCR42DRAFT_406791 [Absidia repens]
MNPFLMITLIYAANLVFCAPFIDNESDKFSLSSIDDDKSKQDGTDIRVYHKLDSIAHLVDAVLREKNGMETGNSGNSNGDDGSHKPPSK